MATIERRNLAPVAPSTTLTRADRPRVYEMIRRHLADQSYHPDGVQRDSRSRADDLEVFISSMKSLQNHVDDPSNILGEAAGDLKKVAEAIRRQIEEGGPLDNIQIPPELSPSTSDNNIIHVDPDPGPYSLPNPVAPSQRPKDFRVYLQSSGGAENAVARQPTRGTSADGLIAALSGIGATNLMQPASRQRDKLRGIVSNQPMPNWPFPPPIFNRS